jgi:hypothetical protein
MAQRNQAELAAGSEADSAAPPQLPVAGYPISEEAVTYWFQHRYEREPTDRELGAIIDAMARREATPPHSGPESEPLGWTVGPSAPPADRR